jgi:hypothetical protein
MIGYVLLLDLLGFSNIVRNLPPEDLDSRILAWVSLVESAAKESSVSKVSMLSDTVFAAAEPSQEGLMSLVSMAKIILKSGTEQAFPVKGAITHGEYNWGQLVYGKAVIDAHELESQQNWIGISCAIGLPHIESMWGFDKLICYTAPKKAGHICIHPVVSWDVPNYEQLQASTLKFGLSKAGEMLSWPWADKIQHTIAFSIYKRIISSSNCDPSKFHNSMPIHTIDLNVK